MDFLTWSFPVQILVILIRHLLVRYRFALTGLDLRIYKRRVDVIHEAESLASVCVGIQAIPHYMRSIAIQS